MDKNNRIAIIGAGPCGLGQLIAFENARKSAGGEVPEIVCFDKQNEWGGLWNYTWRTGLDENGNAVHSSMYRYLWSNGPKECLEFSDYSFEEHYKRPIPSYPPRAVLADYITGRAIVNDVRKYIRFQTLVQSVEYDDATSLFTLTYRDFVKDVTFTEQFSHVICASGHFSIPNVPHFAGIEKFAGRVLHAHDFRSADEFAGKDILLVGSSYSAEDIGLQCYKYGAKSVTFSYRTKAMGFKWPDTMKEVPLLERLEGNVAHFKDGQSKSVDAIILCTGYLHSFPFLADNLRLRSHNRFFPPNLYKGVCWVDNPKLLYLGMQDQFYTFNMFDAQAYYVRDIVLGKTPLPSKEDMHKDMEKWITAEAVLTSYADAIRFQGEYTRDLMINSDYPAFDIDAMNELFFVWEHNKSEDILRYRDHAHPSIITGTPSPMHHTPWLQALDDSMKTFLNAPTETETELASNSV